MPQESPRYLAVVRNGEIECARGTRGPREIADPLRLWVAARERTLKMVQPCCSVQWLPHVGARAGETNLLLVWPLLGAHSSLPRESCWTGGNPQGARPAALGAVLQGREAALLPCSHTTSVPGLLWSKAQPQLTPRLLVCPAKCHKGAHHVPKSVATDGKLFPKLAVPVKATSTVPEICLL